MRILAVDIGTGTQDILLFDTGLQAENCFKLVMPSPTMMVAQHVKEATRARCPLLLTGVTMGGGPSHWAVRDHALAGNRVYATEHAALTFDDDLSKVTDIGIEIVSEDEAQKLKMTKSELLHLELHDFDYQLIAHALERFGVPLYFDGCAVAVFDHGAAPLDISDRQFRFNYLDERIRKFNALSAFAFPAAEVPQAMTRLRAVAASARLTELPEATPLMVMDTAPAAILGATLDPHVALSARKLAVNVGNFHTLAFRLGEGGIEGVFEHHTGFLNTRKLDRLIDSLADGTLQHLDVFNDEGHGALLYTRQRFAVDEVTVTGPRRSLMNSSKHRIYFAVPYGDMMIAGCFGLVRAWADVFSEDRAAIMESLGGAERAAPWELL